MRRCAYGEIMNGSYDIRPFISVEMLSEPVVGLNMVVEQRKVVGSSIPFAYA